MAKIALQDGYVILDPLIDYIASEQRKDSAIQQKLIALVFVFLNAKVCLRDDREHPIVNQTSSLVLQSKDIVFLGADFQCVESTGQTCANFLCDSQQIYLWNRRGSPETQQSSEIGR